MPFVFPTLWVTLLAMCILQCSCANQTDLIADHIFPCVPRYQPEPCHNCTAAEWMQALQLCQPPHADGRIATIIKGNNTTDAIIAYEPVRQGGRLGNILGSFFSAAGLATLAGIPMSVQNRNYDGIQISALASTPQMRAPDFARVRELEYYCKTCPPTTHWPHMCPGPWILANISHALHEMFARERAPVYDVVIQFRCSDSHKHYLMGLLPLQYYISALTGRANSSTRIAILMDPVPSNMHCCVAMPLVLLTSLRYLFKCSVELLHPTTVANDFSIMMNARLFIGSPSTFGLFAALGSTGLAFLPAMYVLAARGRPCFEHVDWIPVDTFTRPCVSDLQHWFINATTYPELAEQLADVFRNRSV